LLSIHQKKLYTMKTIIIFLSVLCVCFLNIKSHAQCTANITGGGCEGTVLTSNTSGGTLEQLIWKWKSRNDSTVLISTASVYYPGGVIVAGGNGLGSENNQCRPLGLFIDNQGNLYVVDAANIRVQKWLPGATEGITVAGGNGYGSAANQFASPQDVLVDSEGNIYIADAGNNRIQKWAPGANEGITVIGGPDKVGSGPHQLNGPQSLFLQNDSILYIMDYGNQRVQKWVLGKVQGVTVAGGNGIGRADNQIAEGSGIFVDKEHNVYVADGGYYNNRVQKWVPGAKEGITVAGSLTSGSGSKQLDYPQDVWVDSLGSIYVADASNYRIQKWIPGTDSGVTVIGSNSGLTFCNSIFLTGDIMYVAEVGSYRVQKFVPGVEVPQIDKTYTPVNGGTYTVTAVFRDGCTVTSPSVHIKGLPKFKSIKGQKRNLCGGGTFIYSVDAIGEALTYNWTVPAGCTILNGQGTSSVTLNIPSNFVSGTLAVSADNRCGTGPVFYDTISTKPNKPGIVQGPAQVASFDTVTYSIEPETGITYRWEIPIPGVVIISGQNTASVTAVWNTYNAGGNVIVKALACAGGAESSSRLAVTTISSFASNDANALITKNSGLKIYPNPAQNTAVIAFEATGSYTIQVSDASGNLFKTIKGNAVTGQNKVNIDLSNLSKGMYFITLIDKNKNKQVVTLTKQ
jgi:sugar lactone lactonase YvrE